MMDDLPEAEGLSNDELRKLRDFFGDTGQTVSEQGNDVIAAWCRAIVDRYAAELNLRAREARELQRIINHQRKRRPHGQPGDVAGIDPWSEVSWPPDRT